MLQGPLTGPLNHRAVREGITEGHAQFNDPCARLNRRQGDFARGREIGIAAGDIGDKSGLAIEVKWHEGYLNRNQSNFRFSRRMPTSLSPRPETFTIRISDFFIFGARLIASATACADSSAGIMPSVRASTVVAFNASTSDAGIYWTRPESLSIACSGPIEG